MIWLWALVIWSITILFFFLCRQKSRQNRLPPGPPAWPVFGHIFSLGTMPHRTITGLRKQYGPVVWLKLGSVNTMVILTAKAASEFFKNHDICFADRTITEVLRSHDYHRSSMIVAPYGTYWRVLRRICTVEMLTNNRVNESASIRQKCVNNLLAWVQKEEGRGVHVARLVFLASFNLIGNMVFSRDLVDPESKVGSEFFKAMMGVLDWFGCTNVSEYLFPWLKWFDLQRIRKEMDRDLGKTMEIAARFVKQRIKEREDGEGGERRNDFLDVLLDFEGKGKDEPSKLTERDVTIFTMEMFTAGAETTSTTIEWALTEVLCNPKIMSKVKAELANVVGLNKKLKESDTDNLHYLQAVIKETFRLHPPGPFLIPRKAIQDTNFMGYDISKNTQVFVSVLAIGRDPESWDDPLSFKPERFLGSDIDFRGQHFELMPFGAGRRMCPAIPLAHRTVPLILGSLLHEFDWKLDNKVGHEKMDMKEKMGLAMRKLEPLKAIPKKIYVEGSE